MDGQLEIDDDHLRLINVFHHYKNCTTDTQSEYFKTTLSVLIARQSDLVNQLFSQQQQQSR